MTIKYSSEHKAAGIWNKHQRTLAILIEQFNLQRELVTQLLESSKTLNAAIEQETIINIKGSNDLLLLDYPGIEQDCALKITGGTAPENDFKLTLTTTYSEQSTNNSFAFEPAWTLIGNMERTFTARQFVAAFRLLPDLQVADFRLAFDFFSPRLTWGIISYPRIIEQLVIESYHQKLAILIRSLELSSATERPLADNAADIVDQLESFLQASFSFSLKDKLLKPNKLLHFWQQPRLSIPTTF